MRLALAVTKLVIALALLSSCGSGTSRAIATDAGGRTEGGPTDTAEHDADDHDGRQDEANEPSADGPSADLLGDLVDVKDGPTDGGVADGSMSATTSCDWGVFNEGTLQIRVLDGAGTVVPCNDAACAFAFAIDDHRLDGPTTPADGWYFSLLGSGDFGTWTISRLQFYIAWGWDVTWSAGRTIDVLNLVRTVDCPSVGANQEYPVQTHLSLRDDNGALLLLSAPDVPLAPSGQALLDSAFAPELSVAWTELGCPAYQGSGVGPEGGGRRTVGILVREIATGNQAVATWGRNATLQIRGEPYVLAVNQGWVFADGLSCGRAKFTLYREGYLFRP